MTIICDCKIIKTIYSKDNFQIYSCVPTTVDYDVVISKYGNFTILGDLSLLEVGKEYQLELEEEDGKYGKQYKVISIPSLSKFKIDNINDLTSAKEIELLKHIMSDSQATFVNKAYPHFIQMILKGEDDKIDYRIIQNVAKIRLESYIQKVTSLFKYYKVMQDNIDMELSYAECTTLCKAYSSLDAIQEAFALHPYLVLISVLNRPFPQVDNLLMQIYPRLKTDPQRCEYLLCYLLELNENDGNTRINGNILAQYVKDWNSDLLPLVKEVSINSGLIYYDEETKDLALYTTYSQECYIADVIKEKINKPTVWNIDWTKYRKNENITLTNEQTKILELICKYDFCMLVGNSGGGKSSSVKSIIDMLEDNDLTYTLLAPSGIASKRLREVTKRKASTIHKRILSGGDISSDVVLIDEASMCDIHLFSHLLNKIDYNSKVVCVFDNAQLASIQCGNLVQDLLDSNIIPTARLTKIFRYGIGGISTVGTDAREGRSYLSSDGKLKCSNSEKIRDYEFIPISSRPKEQVFSVYKSLLNTYEPKDILILTPFNVGAFGTYSLNNKIQEECNPIKPMENTVERKLKDAPNGKITFRVGDKVINKKNDYNAVTIKSQQFQGLINKLENEIENVKINKGNTSEEYYEKYDELTSLLKNSPSDTTVYNGDIGFIKDIDKNGYTYVQFDEEIIVYDKLKLKNLLLAYACTSHSSQGCEAKAVIFLTHPQHKKMLSKNLCYMSLTRAKEKLIEIGDVDTINEALKISETQERNTYLKSKLLLEVDND